VFFVIVELLLEEEAWDWEGEGVVVFVCTFAELFIDEGAEELGVIFGFKVVCEEFFISDKSMGLFGVFFELFDSRLWVLKM